MCARFRLLSGFITRAIRKANANPPEKATVVEPEIQLEQARALAELVSCSVKQLGKERDDEKVHVDQGVAIKKITLEALPNDCRCVRGALQYFATCSNLCLQAKR